MAEKKTSVAPVEEVVVEEIEDEVVRPITLRDEQTGNIYLLEFDRDTVKYAEQHGFDTSAKVLRITDMEELFFYAFRKHHPNMSKANTDKILYEKLHGFPEGMVGRLVALFAIPYKALVQKEDDEKNATMTVEF